MRSAFTQQPPSPPAFENVPFSTKVGKHNTPLKIGSRKIAESRSRVTNVSLQVPERATSDRVYIKSVLGLTPQVIGKGTYGTVFLVTQLTPALRSRVQQMHGALTNRITQRTPSTMQLNSSLVIKVISLRHVMNAKTTWASLDASSRTRMWRTVLDSGLTEATLHAYLDGHPPIPFKLSGGAVVVRPSDYVPTFYAAGTDLQHGVFVVLMSMVEGTRLGIRIPTQPPNTPANLQNASRALIVANVEKALLTLAVAGVEHGDAHWGNILVLPDNSVKLIDFGISILVSPDQQYAARNYLHMCLHTFLDTGTWPDAISNAVFYGSNGTGADPTSIARYANAFRKREGLPYFYFGGKTIRYYKTRVAKPVLDAARRYVWFGINTAPGPGFSAGLSAGSSTANRSGTRKRAAFQSPRPARGLKGPRRTPNRSPKRRRT
jgi:serine/threonine protein kinase